MGISMLEAALQELRYKVMTIGHKEMTIETP